jgi:hypothetical protein
VGAADQRAPEPTGEPSFADQDGFERRDIDEVATQGLAMSLTPTEFADASLNDSVLSALDWLGDSDGISERADARGGKICGKPFSAPTYESYHAVGSNAYSPIYSYYTVTGCAKWSWSFQSAQSKLTLKKPPISSVYPSNGYATEHIYEIQQVAKFVQYARQNIPLFKQMYPNDDELVATGFCADFFKYRLDVTTAFSQASYDYTVKPMQQAYNALSGGTGDASDFVYLNANVNGLKGRYFRGFKESAPDDVSVKLFKITRTAVLADYLNDARVARIYRLISDRVRSSFVNFGRACADPSAQAGWATFGQIDWAGAYDTWEQQYLNGIQTRMRSFVGEQYANVKLYLKLQATQGPGKNVPPKEAAAQKKTTAKMRAQVQSNGVKLTNQKLSLAKLLRS